MEKKVINIWINPYSENTFGINVIFVFKHTFATKIQNICLMFTSQFSTEITPQEN
jgi:hypothetical protein